MSAYKELNAELKKHGIDDIDAFGETYGPVNRLVNSKLSSKPYVEILIKYLGKLNRNESEMVVRALTEKGNKKAVPMLLEMFKSGKDVDLWVIGNALYVIDDKNSYDEILKLCQDKSYGIGRQMLMGTLARMKSEKAYRVLVECLFDSTVKGHAIEGLGRLGNPNALEILEKIEVEKGKYEFKAKHTAIRRLERKKYSS
ncbi:HEAT repeat domain-containing protein [Maribacter dokdonensis]|uniref:HEAT repeat domain-containing protein n=1 Tax=Maribacter dokdonensis TaxID=320912 RepID=UPI0007199577|nr:HEAT repeat domain-containing protein [Maribacter dokdonensis]KSA12161.1 PBS lyase HEAT domain protein repeat-containing protein [Maribacter dokdonensis DSW-8]